MNIDKTAKKILALILSFALILSVIIVPGMIGAVGGEEELDVWDGTYVQPVDADKDGVLEIYTPEELAWFVKYNGRSGEQVSYPGTTAKLMNDIWLNDMLVTVTDGVPSATKATDTSVVIDLADDANNGLREWFDGVNGMWFVGSIDGNNHVINGLYVKHNADYSSNTYGAGLVPRLGAAAKFTNIGIENSYMNTTADYTSAFIVGSAHSAKATVINCYVGESCYHCGKKAAAIVGGGGAGAHVEDCYTLATIVKSNSDSGVIIGDSWGGEKIYNCYTSNGYKLRRASYGTLHDSYSFSGVPTKEDMLYLGGAFLVEEGKYPVLRSFVEGADKGWNGLQERPFDRDGDELLEIDNASALYYATLPGTKWQSFELTNDIIFNDITVKIENGVGVIYDAKGNKVEDPTTLNQWHTGGTVVDTVKYYGNNHVVRGIVSNYTYETSGNAYERGLGIINKGWAVKIYDLGVEDMYVSAANGSAAGFIACVQGQKGNEINGCYLAESVYLTGKNAAGCFGGGNGSNMDNHVKNSYILATMKAPNRWGALTGDIWGCNKYTVTNTYATTKLWGNNEGVTTNSYSGVVASTIVAGKAPAAMPNLSGFVVTDKYPTLASFCESTNVWSGWKAKGFTAGSGSATDPFIIKNGEELAYAISKTAKIYVEDEAGTYKYDEETSSYVAIAEGETYEGKRYSYVAPSFKLANDIYLNDITKIDWATGAVAEGYGARTWYVDTAVQGTFDGDGHVVYGMYYNVTPKTTWEISGSVALFPRILDGAILNVTKLGVDNAFVSASNNASAFVGSNSANNQDEANKTYYYLSESFSGANVTLKSYLTGSAVAGLRDLHANISDCYFLDKQYGSTAGSNYGITGDAWGGSARYYRVFSPTQPLSRKDGNIAVQSNAYIPVGAPNAGTQILVSAMKGDAALSTMAGLGDKFVTTDSYPTLRVFLDEVTEANKTLGIPVFEGAGTEEDPYLVSNASQLKAMVGLGGKDAYYKLTNDIYLNDVNAVNWKAGTVNEGYIPDEWFAGDREDGKGYTGYLTNNQFFSGHIDGNGYAIHGMYYKLGNTHTVVGLLPYVNGTVTIKDLGIEDSFIGGGRFTGGFISYTTGSAKVSITGCYIDDSCAVFGWDAGAAYVNADSDIHTSGGNGLCLGKVEYGYNEAENGTYKLDGDNYVEIAKDEEYEGTRYTRYNIWYDVHFTSEALGGFVGRFENGSTGNLENCFVTAEVKGVSLKIFGFNSQGVIFKEEGTNGSASGHLGGMWGDDWSTVKHVTATNCFSVSTIHENESNATFVNCYTLGTPAAGTGTKITVATGAEGLSQMIGFDPSVWYAVKADGAYPALRLRGTVIGDVDENGIGAEFTDTAALRMTIIGANNNLNANFNREGNTDVCDLVALTLEAQKKNKIEEEANAKLLFDVFVSDSGSNANDGSYEAPVKTLDKAYSMVKDGGYVNVVDTLTVTSLPKGSKFAILCGGTIDMSSLDVVSFGSDTIINDCTLKFKDGATVYANGKDLVIESATKVEGIPAAIYGGGNYPVTETYLDLRAGSYKKIYGGGDAGAVREDAYLYLSHDVNADLTFANEGDCYVYGGSKTGTVYGDTVVIVEGNVNAPLDHTSHTAIARFYGGSENGDVKGSTSVIISENAEFNYIYGGCAKGTVGGATYVNFSAKAMSIYGGSGTVTETNVIINDGWVHQVFGGCEGSSMTGNTNVTIKGGYIDRRIVGGCYNNYSIASGWTTENYVTGTCTVTLRDEATYNLKGDDHGITALSRHKTNHEAENGIVFFENDALKNSLNDHMGITIFLSKTPAYDSYKIG